MKILKQLRELFLIERANELPAPTFATNAEPSKPRMGNDPDWLLSTDPALCVAVVYRCVKLLSESVAQLPFRLMKDKDGVFVPYDTNNVNYLLGVQPDPWRTSFDMKAAAVAQILMHGNAFILPKYSTDPQPDELLLLSPGSVTFTGGKYVVEDSIFGIQGKYKPDELIHLKGMPGTNPFMGVSVLAYATRTINISRAGDAETLKRFRNGGNVRGVLGNDKAVKGWGKYQDQQLEYAAIDIDEKLDSGANIIALPGMVDFKQFSMSSADMQFIQCRALAVRDICRFFGVHPSFVFDDTSNNYKSAEMANVAFLSNTLNPLLSRIEAEFNRKLIAPSLWTKYRYEFDRRALYATDLETRAKYYQSLLGTGTFTINEIRRMENQPAVQGGDTVLVSANLKSIDELTANNNNGQ